MKALFLGHFAAGVAPRILAKVKTPLETSVLDDEGDAEHLAPLLSEAEIVVGHIWRPSFPPAPRIRLLQSVAAGLDLLDTEAVPKGVTICNVFGHDPAIAEYVIMTMLVLTHRLFDAVTAFREGSWVASPQFGGGAPHGEVMGSTIGIIGYGTSHWGITESRDQLRDEYAIETDYLRLRAYPFTREVHEFVEQHDRIYLVEQNRDAQMLTLLKLDLKPELTTRLRSIAHINGLPLDARSITDELTSMEGK